MSERLDAVSVRESNGKSYFTKIGVAFAAKNGGGGYSVLLDAMPAPVDGQFKILLMVPKPREDRQQGGGQPSGGSGNWGGADLSDDVPFIHMGHADDNARGRVI